VHVAPDGGFLIEFQRVRVVSFALHVIQADLSLRGLSASTILGNGMDAKRKPSSWVTPDAMRLLGRSAS
jgi:hypothetical protein